MQLLYTDQLCPANQSHFDISHSLIILTNESHVQKNMTRSVEERRKRQLIFFHK